MAQLAYSTLNLQWQNPNFVARLQVALVQTALVEYYFSLKGETNAGPSL